jgi:hypothetical protein
MLAEAAAELGILLAVPVVEVVLEQEEMIALGLLEVVRQIILVLVEEVLLMEAVEVLLVLVALVS